MILTASNGQMVGAYYVASGGVLTAFTANTSYTIDYTYLEKVTD